MNQTNIQAVVFDLYKTLIYLADETEPYIRLFKDIGLQTSGKLKQECKIALTENFDNLADLVKKIKPDMQVNLKPYQQELEKEISSAKLYAETREVLEELRKKNIKLGLISNLASPYKRPFFEFGLNKYFDEVLFSCDVGLRKHDPRIYQKIIRNLNINPAHVLMTGDNVYADVKGPKSIGMNAVHLDRKNDSLDSISTLRGVFQYLD